MAKDITSDLNQLIADRLDELEQDEYEGVPEFSKKDVFFALLLAGIFLFLVVLVYFMV